MKTVKVINYNNDLEVIKMLNGYIAHIGLNPPLYGGKSSRKVYSERHLDYQVVIYQTKRHIVVEVQKH